MGSREFSRWIAYDSIEPIGDDRADWRMACLMSLLYSLNRKKRGKYSKPVAFLRDFFGFGEWAKRRQTGATQKTGSQVFAQIMNFAKQHNEAIEKG